MQTHKLVSRRMLAASCALLFAPFVNALPPLAEPAIAPDRSEVAFISGGDIWTVPLAGGEARLLVAHPATESRPRYSPDGKYLAFVSTRTGNGDIYVLTLASGDLRRVTFDDGMDQLDAWSPDGKYLYYSSTSRDISGMSDIYRVPAAGGTPMPVSADRYAAEYWAAPAPTGGDVAFTAKGIVLAQWWRHGHSHLDESEIWIRRANAKYDRITTGGAKDEWPMWSADGKGLYFVSDRNGNENIWWKPANGEPRAVTAFRDGRVLWPCISPDGRTIVFERDFGIWKADTKSGKAEAIAVTLRGSVASPAVTRLSLTNQFRDLAISPDGKKAAFIIHGEVFAASTKDGGTASRLTHTAAAEQQLAWAPDSRRLVYASLREGAAHLFLYDFSTGQERQLTRGALSDGHPIWSPDGKLLAFVRDASELRTLDVAASQERVIAKATMDRGPLGGDQPCIWSPDSRWLAFASVSDHGFRNVSVVAASGATPPRPISFLANVFSGRSLAWSPDGEYLLFETGQRTEQTTVARVDLLPHAPKFREDLFRDLFKDDPAKPNLPVAPGVETAATTPAAPDMKPKSEPEAPKRNSKKPVEIVFEGIRRRLTQVPTGLDADSLTISPDGKTLLLTASAASQQNLYTYSLDELAKDPPVARQLTSTPGRKSNAQFSQDGKEVFYLEDGKLSVIGVDNRAPRPLAVTAEMDVDFDQEKRVAFEQAWSTLNDIFYDPEFHGQNWAALKTRFEPYIDSSRTPDEMRRLINLMIGELNASHSGIGAPQAGGRPVVGRLGVRLDPAAYDANGALVIKEIVALSPAALAKNIAVGDAIVAVDGEEIKPQTNLDDLLQYKVGKRVSLTVANSAGAKHEVVLQPVSVAAEKQLLYRQWVEANREYVAKISGGKLGYVHMPDMSADSLANLYADLDADNFLREGVVIDIRNNNGGFVNAYALDVFTRRGYLNMTPRGQKTVRARTQLGQRSLEIPTVLVTNQHSLSDAEDFTEGYRALKLGKVVGEPTSGWIIYTSGTQLIDGSTLRLPFIRITDTQGRNMERNPRPVDIPVTRPIGESETGHDVQLDAAVKQLLEGKSSGVSRADQ